MNITEWNRVVTLVLEEWHFGLGIALLDVFWIYFFFAYYTYSKIFSLSVLHEQSFVPSTVCSFIALRLPNMGASVPLLPPPPSTIYLYCFPAFLLRHHFFVVMSILSCLLGNNVSVWDLLSYFCLHST